ncbi:unnamed protein product [Dibothriocephalus latus]|uniref:Uncharacterized protein n=1 Tax=Dibothriocephalus latus TaxID=60516 RepID=A0A3P7LP74_DIBLA|nr:unnamed protein product [Dibothriocephalus latus]
MAYVRLKGHFTNSTVASVYVRTSAAEQRDKETFYSKLQALVERFSRHDLLIVFPGTEMARLELVTLQTALLLAILNFFLNVAMVKSC